jgi:hypothetical protein
LGRRAAATVGTSHGGLIANVACARRPPMGSDAQLFGRYGGSGARRTRGARSRLRRFDAG